MHKAAPLIDNARCSPLPLSGSEKAEDQELKVHKRFVSGIDLPESMLAGHRLIQKYITKNGTDPVTGEKLEESELVSIKASTYVPLPLTQSCSEGPFRSKVLVRPFPDLQLTHPYPHC
jgi:hypothetical protein